MTFQFYLALETMLRLDTTNGTATLDEMAAGMGRAERDTGLARLRYQRRGARRNLPV